MDTHIKTEVDRLLADGKIHEPADRAVVVEAYMKLVDCITTYRTQGKDR